MPAAVEVMASTPNSQGVMDSSNASDKKRNKLGYHRTSVACVHCRRRKIRCLVAPDDAQGRCENCIRLRKDCQFFPVDQQPPIEKKSRSNSRLESQSADRSVTTPISSSPTNLSTEPVETYYSYPQVPLNASGQEVASFNPGAFAGNSMSGFAPDRAMGPGEFSGHPTLEPGVSWDEFTTISDPQMLATMTANKGQMMNLTPNVWNPSSVPSGIPPNSPMSGASPMSGHAQPMNAAPTYAMQPDGTVWQVPPQPTRAMSFPGQAQGMSSSYPTQFQPQMPTDLKRRMTTPAQPISAPNPGTQSSPGSSTDMQPPQSSVPYQASAGMGYAQWPSMHAMAPVGVVPYPMYAGDPTQQPPFTNLPMGHPQSGP